MTGAPASTVPPAFRALVEETAEVAARFSEAGHALALVGGPVRDALFGKDLSLAADPDADLDFCTTAKPDEIKALVKGWADAVWTQGERFGTIGFLHHGRKHEVTTYRAEAYAPDSRNPEVVFATDIEADLSRRDFTINAMALELTSVGGAPLRLLDPFGGLDDLLAKRLRTPLSPEVSFGDDPLRMLRAARFLARFDLVADADLTAAVVAMAERLSIISAERIRDELDKLMVTDPPGLGRGLWFLVQTGLSKEFLPELDAMQLEQDPIHRHKDVLAHTIAVVEKTSPDRILRLAALLHDIGKPKTRSFEKGKNGVSFHHHEVVGARMTRERMRALKYANEDVKAVSELVHLHLRFHTFKMGWTDSAVRRYVRDAGPLLERLNELTRCDCTTRNAKKAAMLDRRMDELEERIAVLQADEELAAIRPDLDGEAVMAHLGLPPGRDVGEALKFLLELRLEEGPLGAEEATRRLDAWWAERTAQQNGQT